MNIGSNFEVSIGETAQLIAKLMGVDLQILTDEQRMRPERSEVQRLWADNSKAQTTLGWTPKYAGMDGLERGLKKTIDWFLKRKYAGLQG